MEAQTSVVVERYPCGKRRRLKPRSPFQAGDHVEFWSADRGGMWKPGIVADDQVLHPGALDVENERLYGNSANMRIVVGKITIVRPRKRCRMAQLGLPIDVVPGSHPPQFVWSQIVHDMAGDRKVVEHRGPLPPSVEHVVAELISKAKSAMHDNAMLRGQVDSLIAERARDAESTTKPTSTQTGKRKG